MYKRSDSIKNIKSVFTLFDDYILVDKDEKFYFNSIEEKEYQSLYFILNRYILKNKEDTSFLFFRDNLIRKLQGSYLLNTYTNDGCFYYEDLHYDSDDNKVKKDIYYHDFNRDEKKIIKKGVSESFLFKDFSGLRTITFDPKTIIRSLSLLTGEYEWEVDLGSYTYDSIVDGEQPGQIRAIIGVWKGVLLVWMEGGWMLGIDVNTGKVLWEWHQEDFTSGLASARDFNLRDFQWHLEGDRLYVLRNRFFLCLDLPTLSHEVLWEDTSLDFYISLPAYGQDLIAFTACLLPSIQPTILGVFSRESLRIEWLERTDILQRDQYASFDQPPQMDEQGQRLYFLDSTGTLHIFEREGE